MRQLIDTVADALTAAGFAPKDIFGVRLTLEEAIINGIKHGHRGDPTQVLHVRQATRLAGSVPGTGTSGTARS